MARQLKARPDGPSYFWDTYCPPAVSTSNTLVQDLHRSMDRILGPNPCRLGISPLCTREDAYDWQGKMACGHCYSMAEAAMDAEKPVLESDQVRR